MPSAGRWPEWATRATGARSVRWGLLAAGAGGLYAYAVTHLTPNPYAGLAGLIALSLGLLLAFTRSAGGYALLLLSLPLSVEVPLGSATNDYRLLFPSEALMAVLGIAFGVGALLRRAPDPRLLRHPLTGLILLYLGWLGVTAGLSARLVVSLKWALVQGAYVAICYGLAYEFLSRRPSRVPAFFFLYGAPALLVVGYALYHHATVGFYHDASAIVVRPFYPDHTMYSACLALLLPGFVAFAAQGQVLGLSKAMRGLSAAAAGLLAVAIYFSFSRAAWLGLGAALLFYGALRLRVRPATLGGLLLAGLALALLNQDALIQRLKLNRHSSSERNADLTAQTLSVANISSDVSNAERLNRWSCAWRMFLDRPLTGFGPGTYQFEYLTYQRPAEMTRISVTTPYHHPLGRGGSAHSEYLLALAETGLPGLLLLLALVVGAVRTGMRAYYRTPDARTRLLLAIVLTSLVGFVTHVLFNNFLNSNKAAALFWGLLALLVRLDNGSRAAKAGEAPEVARFP